jgi:hypothetical protein
MVMLVDDIVRAIDLCATGMEDLANLMLLDKRWSAVVRPILEKRKREMIYNEFSAAFEYWDMKRDFRPYIGSSPPFR